jgi:tetratricopeptide (TPR) repeat protein
MSSSRLTSIRTRSESRRQIPVAAIVVCVLASGCAGPGTGPEYENPLVDPLPASALARRGDSFEQRQLIAELNRKQDWAGLLRFAEGQQGRDPENSDWGVIAGYAWLRSRDYPKAAAVLSRVTQRSPEDLGAWNLLGESQRLAGQPERAARTLEYAGTIGRNSFVTFFLLGEAYREAGRLDRAIAAYRESLGLEPAFARGWFELGSAQARIGEREGAGLALEQLRKLDPALAEQLKGRLQGALK